jgi:uncharacterized protein (DUF1501 family)
MQRRHLLQALGLGCLTVGAPRLYAAPSTAPGAAAGSAPRLLVVFLRGGYDCANLLVPIDSSFYYEARPSLAIQRPDAQGQNQNPNAALSLDTHWGLHPALRDSIYPLFQKGQVAFVPFAGTEDLSRSHFETQDSIELGQPLEGSRDFRSGFMNRLAAALGGLPQPSAPMSFTDQLPIAFRGGVDVPNMALKSLGKPGVDERQGKIITAMYAGTPLAAPVTEGFGVRTEVLQDVLQEMDAAGRNAISAKGFEAEARRIAHLMRERFNLGFVDVGGWDTHVGEGGATGYLANRFDEFGRGLAGFADAMGSDWNNTVVVVVSEFGRTFRENGNRGTDHGHGSVYWVLGGSIKGGRVVGRQVKVEQATLFQNRDFPVLNDYRSVLGGVAARLYGLGPERLAQVFPKAQPEDLGLL